MIDFVRKGKSTKDATAVASDILQDKTAYVDDKKITGSIVTATLPSSLTLVDEEKDITSANNNILDYFVLDDEEFVVSSSTNTNMSSIVVQNSVTQNTINISDIKSSCVLLSAKLFDLNIAGEIGMLAVLSNVSARTNYLVVISLNVNDLSITNIYIDETVAITQNSAFFNIIYNSIKNCFAILLRTWRGQSLDVYIVQCSKNSIIQLSHNSTYVASGNNLYYKNFLDGYWDSVGEKLVVNSYQYSGGEDKDVSYLFTFSSNLTTVNCIVLNSGGKNTTPYQFLNEEYLINRNNQIYKINNSSVSLYKTVSNVSISNKQAYDKIITLNNCFYLYFNINNSKIYIYKYDAGFNFTYEDEISWSINSTNVTYSYLMYCPKIIDNIVKYSELNKIKEIYATTNSPDFASLERNNVKYFNTNDADAIASNVLENKIAYGANKKIIGAMPNNGQLNYTPSTSKQTIPAGYTSGGSIEASPQSQEDYDDCLLLTYQILGTEILYNDYILQELLSLDGSKYIDLGIKVNLNNTYKLKFKDNTVTGYEAYIGTTANNTFFCRNGTSNNTHVSNMTSDISSVPTVATETSLKFTSSANNNIWLGSTGGSGVPNADYDFYYLEVYDTSNNLINNLVPVKKISTDTLGLLDLVTMEFIEC